MNEWMHATIVCGSGSVLTDFNWQTRTRSRLLTCLPPRPPVLKSFAFLMVFVLSNLRNINYKAFSLPLKLYFVYLLDAQRTRTHFNDHHHSVQTNQCSFAIIYMNSCTHVQFSAVANWIASAHYVSLTFRTRSLVCFFFVFGFRMQYESI